MTPSIRRAALPFALVLGAGLAAAQPSDPYAPAGPTYGPSPPPPAKPGVPTIPVKADPPPAPKKADPKPPAPTPPATNKAPADPYAAPAKGDPDLHGIPARVAMTDIGAVQGLLSVQRLDGWLLFDKNGENPIATSLVRPDGKPTRSWFYLVPAKGQPTALVHESEKRSFEHLVGTKLTYTGYRDFDKALRDMLKGVKTIAVEYSQKAAVPNISRVDAGTMEIIRGAGVAVRSSDTLVQYTKAIWGDAGRTAHYVAAHHLAELRKDALAFVAKQLTANAPVTEYDVQQRIVRGMTMRGLSGTAPVVAAGVNSADPYYVPSAARSAAIKRGDMLIVALAARVDKPDGVYAAQTWSAVADSAVPDLAKRAFASVTIARDQALALIADRNRKGRPVTGADVDAATRAYFKKAGVGDKVMHRTGHSIDNDLQGGGADLDDFEVRDTRILTAGTGFTLGPGLYWPGQWGLRSEVSVYFAPNGPEMTSVAQEEIETLLLPSP
ncbi:MAG: aminopeptidase P family protein [Deltaproteobacteria bacterium]|nr:aminopeptidase P family protein [Deltaproteobacteria bacterium]